MKLDNGILNLELTNKGGEMSRLLYKGYDVLYRGDGSFWSGKNPTLFPMISSPDAKEYVLNGNVYPCRNHGLIRYSELETIKESDDEITMRLLSSDDTKKEYPFDFDYRITYKLDNNKVLINYEITNTGDSSMPFTFGLHPGFIVRDFNDMEMEFIEDEEATLFNQKDRTSTKVKLGKYTGQQFLSDLGRLHTVIFEHLKSPVVTLKMKEYNVKVDMSKYNYLALWTADSKANYICIEPWLSINDIKHSDNPFDAKYELEYLEPKQTFKIDYYIELD